MVCSFLSRHLRGHHQRLRSIRVSDEFESTRHSSCLFVSAGILILTIDTPSLLLFDLKDYG